MVPNKRLITPLDGKNVPALRVVPEKAPLGVAYMAVGKGREQDAVALLVCLFGMTTLRASRLD